jgi:hypothetical protein
VIGIFHSSDTWTFSYPLGFVILWEKMNLGYHNISTEIFLRKMYTAKKIHHPFPNLMSGTYTILAMDGVLEEKEEEKWA